MTQAMPAATGGDGRRAVFIVGAGRSGTSTITRALEVLGVDLGTRFKRTTPRNPKGFFENAELLAVSKAVRRAVGLRANSVRLLDDGVWTGALLESLRARAVGSIREQFGHAPLWGFKYGRTLRILPFWEQVLAELGIAASYVVALRNPLSVAHSRRRLDPRRGRQVASDLEWLVSIVPYFRRLRGRPLAVVDYDRLVEAPVAQIDRLATALGMPGDLQRTERVRTFVEAFLTPSLRHVRHTPRDLVDAQDVLPLVREAYALLDDLASDTRDVGGDAFWQDWALIEQDLLRMAPLLAHVDRLEADVRRAESNPLGPLQACRWAWIAWRAR